MAFAIRFKPTIYQKNWSYTFSAVLFIIWNGRCEGEKEKGEGERGKEREKDEKEKEMGDRLLTPFFKVYMNSRSALILYVNY